MISGEFFKGHVHFLSQGIFNAKYSIVENSTIIKVKNSTHVRMLENQYGDFPYAFEIIAPMDAVTTIDGEIPADHIKYLPASTYLHYRKIYIGV